MLKKLIGVVAVTTMALVATVSPSSAQDYPPAPNEITCTDTDLVFAPGDDLVCEAGIFLAGSEVTFTLFSDPVVLGSFTADAAGKVTVATKIPLDTVPGAHRLEASGTDRFGAALVLVVDITVVAAPTQTPPPAEPLPRTGSESLPMAQIAIAAIVAGGFLLIMSNRRRAAVVPATTQESTKV